VTAVGQESFELIKMHSKTIIKIRLIVTDEFEGTGKERAVAS
jgi:hypothetical protein